MDEESSSYKRRYEREYHARCILDGKLKLHRNQLETMAKKLKTANAANVELQSNVQQLQEELTLASHCSTDFAAPMLVSRSMRSTTQSINRADVPATKGLHPKIKEVFRQYKITQKRLQEQLQEQHNQLVNIRNILRNREGRRNLERAMAMTDCGTQTDWNHQHLQLSPDHSSNKPLSADQHNCSSSQNNQTSSWEGICDKPSNAMKDKVRHTCIQSDSSTSTNFEPGTDTMNATLSILTQDGDCSSTTPLLPIRPELSSSDEEPLETKTKVLNQSAIGPGYVPDNSCKLVQESPSACTDDETPQSNQTQNTLGTTLRRDQRLERCADGREAVSPKQEELHIRLRPVAKHLPTAEDSKLVVDNKSASHDQSSKKTAEEKKDQLKSCPACNKQFRCDQAIFEQHVLRCVNNLFEVESSKSPSKASPTKSAAAKPEDRTCPMCDRRFSVATTDQVIYENHVLAHFEAEEMGYTEIDPQQELNSYISENAYHTPPVSY